MFGSIPFGSVAGIPIRLHGTFIAILVIQVLGSLAHGPAYCLLWAILMGPVLLLTVALHEVGHCLAARSVGSEVHGILLWPLGGLAMIGQAHGPKEDIWVAAAGPLMHIPMTIVWVLVLLPVWHATYGTFAIQLVMPYPDWSHLAVAVIVGAIILNISLFAFNLLVPAYPLDGGRILLDMLLSVGVEEVKAAKIVVGVAVPIGLAVVAFGVWPSFQMVTIMVGLFILYSTYQLFEAARSGTLSQHPMFCAGDTTSASWGGNGQGKTALPESTGYFHFGELRI